MLPGTGMIEASRSPSGMKPNPPRWYSQRLALWARVGEATAISRRWSIFPGDQAPHSCTLCAPKGIHSIPAYDTQFRVLTGLYANPRRCAGRSLELAIPEDGETP